MTKSTALRRLNSLIDQLFDLDKDYPYIGQTVEGEMIRHEDVQHTFERMRDDGAARYAQLTDGRVVRFATESKQ
jgi:hypothetical protein